MDNRQLRYFLAIVDAGGVHRAAEALFVAQPSVSQALRGLEADLGTELFYRTGRRLVLTPAGETLVPAAREALHQFDLARAAVDAVDGLRTGKLVMCAMPSQAVYPLARLIGGFLREYPNVRVVTKAAGTVDDVAHAVREGHAELGLLARPHAVPSPIGLQIHAVTEHRYVCISHPHHSLSAAGDRPVDVADLLGARLIVGQVGTAMRRTAEAVLAAAEGSSIAVEIEHREALLPLVLENVGVAIVAESWRGLAESAGLIVRELNTEESLVVELVHRRARLSPAAAAFLGSSGFAIPGTTHR